MEFDAVGHRKHSIHCQPLPKAENHNGFIEL